MKKILVFLFLVILLSFSLHFQNGSSPLFSFYSEGTCEIMVTKQKNQTIPSFAQSVSSGENLFVKADIALGNYLVTNLSDVLGITLFVSDQVENVFKNFQMKLCKSEVQNGNTHYFGFSPLLEKSVFIDGKKCNLHIVCKGEQLVIGYPIIYGSY